MKISSPSFLLASLSLVLTFAQSLAAPPDAPKRNGRANVGSPGTELEFAL